MAKDIPTFPAVFFHPRWIVVNWSPEAVLLPDLNKFYQTTLV